MRTLPMGERALAERKRRGLKRHLAAGRSPGTTRDMGWSLVLSPGVGQREVKKAVNIRVVLVDTET